ncbi:MAG: crotonase/enoyl-CoA hydratase family protein [Pseudomonadota bacterium]
MEACFEGRVRLVMEEGVARVTLARPEAFNGLDWAMIDGLLEAQRRLKELEGLRAVMLEGEGGSFCAGLDMAAIMARPERVPALLVPDAADGVNPVQRLALGWREPGVPVIAALQGHVYGGGLQIALGADIRVAHPETRLALLEIVWGIIPDMAISITAAGLRDDVLRELAWTGRKVGGEEAVALGLVTRLADDPRTLARQMATTIAGHSPKAIAAAGELFGRAPGLARGDRLALEASLQHSLLGGAEQQEAMTARLEGRAAHFS